MYNIILLAKLQIFLQFRYIIQNTIEKIAREYHDDTEAFFCDLRNGENISLLLAPAFIANYPNEYGMILGGLKENVYWFCGEDVFIRQVEGDKAAWEYLKKTKQH